MNGPIAQSLVPDLVGRKNVLNAIALNNAMFNSARIIGPAIAGVLLGTIGAGGCFGINSVSFLAIIGALWLIRLPRSEPHHHEESVWQQILTGLRFVKGHRDIRAIVVLTAVFSSFGMMYLPLMPVFARDVFHSGAREYGVMMTCVGIGAVVGGLTLATMSKTRHKGVILILGTLGIGLLSIALSFVRDIRLALPLIALIGFCQTSITSLMNTLIQTLAPEHIRGRALSVYMLAFNGMFPLGCLGGGGDCTKVRRTRGDSRRRMRRARQSRGGINLRAADPEALAAGTQVESGKWKWQSPNQHFGISTWDLFQSFECISIPRAVRAVGTAVRVFGDPEHAVRP
jgi:predicted MFS family arabinose efflux permease